MGKPKLNQPDLFTHEPLPYVVELSTSLSDDDVPQLQRVEVVAYSVVEAAIQATLQATGSTVVDDQKTRLVSIQPDMARYIVDTAARVAAGLGVDSKAARRRRGL